MNFKRVFQLLGSWIVFFAGSDWLLKLVTVSADHLPPFFWIPRARGFPHFSEKMELFGACSTGLVCTRIIIHLGVGEEWEIFTSPLRGSSNIHHFSPPRR